jgi:hypothetical protein
VLPIVEFGRGAPAFVREVVSVTAVSASVGALLAAAGFVIDNETVSLAVEKAVVVVSGALEPNVPLL